LRFGQHSLENIIEPAPLQVLCSVGFGTFAVVVPEARSRQSNTLLFSGLDVGVRVECNAFNNNQNEEPDEPDKLAD